MRAGDADRERVTELLRDAHGEGRLTQDELMSRLEAAYEARTYRELDQLIDDLPVARRSAVAGQLARRPRSAPETARRFTAQRIMRLFLSVNWWVYGVTVAMCVVVWASVLALTDHGTQAFWPLWVAGPWGVLLGAGELAYRRRWPSDCG